MLTPAGRADVCLPADVPVAELVPMLMELLGTPAPTADRPVPWRLTGAGGGVLPPDATLDELGVLDGELLRLGPAAPPPPPPVFDDPVDALAALAAPTAEPDRRWCAVIVLIGVVPAAALLLGGMRADGSSGAHLWAAVALAGLGAAAAIVLAAQLRRADESADSATRTARSAGPGPLRGTPGRCRRLGRRPRPGGCRRPAARRGRGRDGRGACPGRRADGRRRARSASPWPPS